MPTQGLIPGTLDFGVNEWLYNNLGIQLGRLNQSQMERQGYQKIGPESITTLPPVPDTLPDTLPPATRQSNPAPANTSGSGGSWSNEANKGTWNGQTFYDANEWRKASGQNPGGGQNGGGSQNYGAEMDAIYNPVMASLSNQESLLGGQKTNAMNSLTEQSRQLQESVDAQKLQIEGNINRDKEEMAYGRQNALDEARRAFNQTRQTAQNLYGQGSSAGGAISELVSGEYNRGRASVDRAYQQNLGKIQDYSNQVQTFVFNETQRIARELKLGMDQINQTFSERMGAIMTDRNLIESAKAKQKMDILREAKSRVQNLQDARTSSFMELDIWRTKQQELTNLGLKQVQSDYATTIESLDATATTTPGRLAPSYVASADGNYYRNKVNKDNKDQSNFWDSSQYFS